MMIAIYLENVYFYPAPQYFKM